MTTVCICAESVALSGYLVAAVVYPVRLLRPANDYTRWGRWGLVFSTVLQGMGLSAHLLGAGQRPGNQWANASFGLVLLLCAAMYYIHRRTERPAMAGFLTPVVFLVALAGVFEPNAEMPAVGLNPWIMTHIVLAFLSYAAFGVAFAMAMAYLVDDWSLKHKRVERLPLLPPLTVADDLAHLFAVIGLSLYTLSTAMMTVTVIVRHMQVGAKFEIALLTWLVYAAYIYVRDVPHWRGRRLQAFLVAGFTLVLISFLGVRHSRSYRVSELGDGTPLHRPASRSSRTAA